VRARYLEQGVTAATSPLDPVLGFFVSYIDLHVNNAILQFFILRVEIRPRIRVGLDRSAGASAYSLASTMSTDDRRRRLLIDERQLRDFDIDIADSTCQLTKRKLELQVLQQEILTLEADLDDRRALRRTLNLSIERRRSSLPTRSWASLPIELLAMVIRHVVDDVGPARAVAADAETGVWAVQPVEFNLDRALTPFLLASVCKAWRSVVLGIPRAWSYICVPAPASLASRDAHISHVDFLLETSKYALLDVSITLPDSWLQDPLYIGMLNRLLGAAGRWQRFALWGSWRARCSRAMDYLRAATPMLEHASVFFTDSEDGASEMVWLDPSPDYFPHAPNLRSVRVQHAPIAFKARNTCLTALESLELCYDSYSMQRLVHTFQPLRSLRHLRLHWRLSFTDAHSQHNIAAVTLPNLESLDLQPPLSRRERMDNGFDEIINGLATPALRKLNLFTRMMEQIQPFLARVSGVLEELVIHRDPAEKVDAAILAHLPNLQRIAFVNLRFSGDFFSGITEYAASSLATPTLPGISAPLPHLRLLRFERVSLDAHTESGFVRLLKLRQQSRTGTCVPTDVVFEGTDVAAWVPAEAQHIRRQMEGLTTLEMG